MKIRILRRAHLGRGVIAYPGQVKKIAKEKGEDLIGRGYAEEYAGEEPMEEEKPGWRPKEPCEGCPKKETEHAIHEIEVHQ